MFISDLAESFQEAWLKLSIHWGGSCDDEYSVSPDRKHISLELARALFIIFG
jgi:hypothetical protein